LAGPYLILRRRKTATGGGAGYGYREVECPCRKEGDVGGCVRKEGNVGGGRDECTLGRSGGTMG
jgi:hypothetical protein